MGLSRLRRAIHIHWDRDGAEWRVRYESASLVLGLIVVEWGFDERQKAFDHAREVWDIWEASKKGETACSNG